MATVIIEATPSEAEAVVAALATVADAGGSQPRSAMDRRGIEAAWSVVLGQPGAAPVDGLDAIAPEAVAAIVTDPASRLATVQLAAVMAFVDAVVDPAKLRLVIDLAAALGVERRFLAEIRDVVAGEVRHAGVDMLRANVESIPGLSWRPDDPMAAFLPYGDGRDDPALADRYRALADAPAGSLGRAFFHHYRDNGFAFPGEPWGVVDVWGTPHDTLHLLSGYSTSAQGELLVAVFNGAALSPPDDPMASHVLPVIFTYHLGIELNKGINKGDRERMASDPDWREDLQGNVHLALDPAKLWRAWARGARMTTDVFSGRWDLWSVADEPLDALRERYGVTPLDPADAALDDDRIDRDLFVRPGQALPELSRSKVAERPTGASS